MDIVYDPAKDRLNKAKHGVSLADARNIIWDQAFESLDDRHDYGEDRYVALAPIANRLYYVVFVDRAMKRRIISLRKANAREVKYYVEAKN